MLDRDQLIDALTAFARACPDCRAAYLGGSDATGRADDLSDLDLVVVCDPGSEEAVFGAIEAELERLGGWAHKWRMPSPTWHKMEQAFYTLRQAPAEVMLDLVAGPIEPVRPFLVPERHGSPRILHDPEGLLRPEPLDRAAHETKVRAQIEQLKARFELFQPLVTKEIARGRAIDAMGFYQSLTLRPLVDLLRCLHCPDRYDYGLRYLDSDLPADVAAELRELAYVGSLDDLATAHERARAMFREAIERISE
ncbi:MAG: hypothetical protein ACF8R7_02920 [Phycisphaerales bacterium JB039]